MPPITEPTRFDPIHHWCLSGPPGDPMIETWWEQARTLEDE